MIANHRGCCYDCGLGYPVIIEGYPLGNSSAARVEALRWLIAHAVALRNGPLTGKEIRFLRTYLGLTTEELDDRIDFGAGLIELHELGNWKLTVESDIELRRMVFAHNGTTVPSLEALRALYGSMQIDPPEVRIRPEPCSGAWTLAA